MYCFLLFGLLIIFNLVTFHFRDGLLVCLGNPLLDITVNDDGSLLQKYELKSNNAILAEEKHKPLYQDIVDNFDVEYIAGGAAQNTARITQVTSVTSALVLFLSTSCKQSCLKDKNIFYLM